MATAGQVAKIKMLLAQHAHVNAGDRFSGKTPLYWDVNADVAALLRQHGAHK